MNGQIYSDGENHAHLTDEQRDDLLNGPETPPPPHGPGHNSGDGKERFDSVAGTRLKSIIGRIERLEDEKKGLGDDVKDVYAEAKGIGFDPKIIRTIVRLKKMEPEKRREQDELIDLYKSAIGLT